MTAAATLALAVAYTYNNDDITSLSQLAHCDVDSETPQPIQDLEWAEDFDTVKSLEDIERLMTEQSQKFIYFYRGDEAEGAKVAEHAAKMQQGMGVKPVLLDLSKHGEDFI